MNLFNWKKPVFTFEDLMKYDQLGFRSPFIRDVWFIIYRADIHIFMPSKGDIYLGFGPLFKTKEECQSAIDKIGKKNLMNVFNP